MPPIPQSPCEGVAELREDGLAVARLQVDRLFIDRNPMYMHSNLACVESVTSGAMQEEDEALS